MTANQLRYWELRWKQHYENIMLQLKAQELRITREDLDRKWAELDEKKRAAMVGETIDAFKAHTDRFRALVDFQESQARIKKYMSEINVAEADLAISYQSAKDESRRKWFEAYARAANSGWGQGVIVGSLKESSQLGLAGDLDNMSETLQKLFPNNKDLFSKSKYTDNIDKTGKVMPQESSSYDKLTNPNLGTRGLTEDQLSDLGWDKETRDKAVAAGRARRGLAVGKYKDAIDTSKIAETGPASQKNSSITPYYSSAPQPVSITPAFTASGSKTIYSPSVARRSAGPGAFN